MSTKKENKQKKDAQLEALKQRFKELREGKEFDDIRNELSGFKTRSVADYADQIKILAEKRHILDVNGAYEGTLRKITYYRLKGYLHNKMGGHLSFEAACRFHEFDAQMRVLLSYAISKIEIYLRSQFSYVHCYSYNKDAKVPDPYAYLKAENYSGQYKEILNTIERAIKRNKDTPFVEHYIENYGGLMPLWVVTELLDFGGLVTFYKNWTTFASKSLLHALYGNGSRYHIAATSNAEKHKESKQFVKKPTRFVSWLASCTYLRNVCAHSGRFYYRPFTQLPNLPDEFEPKNVAQKRMEEMRKVCGGNKVFLWGAVLALQFLYPNQDEWNELIVPQIAILLHTFGREIGGSRLRAAIGFPDDWEYWLRFWRTMS